jgi:hypothetical protein
MHVTNKGTETVAFRDDAGKHLLKRGSTLKVTGDQHLPHILSLPGVVTRAPSPRRASRDESE